MSATTITCDVCEEELEWQPGYRLQHHGGTVGYLHTIVFDQEAAA